MSNFLNKQSKHLYRIATVAFYTEEQLSKFAAVICDVLFGEALVLGNKHFISHALVISIIPGCPIGLSLSRFGALAVLTDSYGTVNL